MTAPGVVGAGDAAFFDLLVAFGVASAAATTGVGAGATGAGAGAGAAFAGAGAAFAGAAAFTTGFGAATLAGAAAFTGAAAFAGAATFFAGAAAFFATLAAAGALAARRADVLRAEELRALARFVDFARAGLRADFVGRRVRFELAMARAPM